MVGTMMTGCANDDVTIEVPQPENPNKTVTMTTTISREGGDGATTRALTAEGHKTFEAGDQIAIIYKNTSGETVKVLSETLQDNGDITNSGKKARFTVTLTDPAADGTVRYIYPAAMAAATVATSSDVNADANVNYAALATQDGTLASLATNLDLSIFDGNLSGTQLPASATLSNQLAILELTVKNASGSSVNGSVTKLSVFDGTNVYKIIDRSAVAEPIYVALRPVASDKTIHFCATDGTTNYRKSVVLENNPLERNNIYPVNLSTTETTGTALEFLTADYTMQDGDILSGILLGSYKIITVSTDAAAITVTLNGVDINHHYASLINAHGIFCKRNINLVLAEGSVNYVAASVEGYAGIFIMQNRTLTISGSGTLTAVGKGDIGLAGAGIGATDKNSNIKITDGTITATGGEGAAGIGCCCDTGNSVYCGDITISGGTVTANGGSMFAAGIGTGYSDKKDNQCGNITISGGTVRAKGGHQAAGIGGGLAMSDNGKIHVRCGSITIENTVTLVKATKGTNSICSIGRGNNIQSCGTITIGGTVYWGLKEGSMGEYEYKNGGDTYLTSSPLEYKPQH
jgi:hypothetical protein